MIIGMMIIARMIKVKTNIHIIIVQRMMMKMVKMMTTEKIR